MVKSEIVRLAKEIAYYASKVDEAVDRTDLNLNLSTLKRRVLDMRTEINRIEDRVKNIDKENSNG